jgi:RNA polymerase sigma-70 factor (ECF subfamily)
VSTQLADAFLADRTDDALDDNARRALDAALVALHAEGRDAWPDITVDGVVLARDLARRGTPADADAIAGLCAPDVYLAVACANGDDAAIAAVERSCFSEIEIAAKRTGATPADADEMRAEVRRLLFVAEGDRPAAIATFSGSGNLRAYVRVIATRALIRSVQRGRRNVSLDDAILEAASPVTDPEFAHLRAAYRDDVAAAVREACGALDSDARALLRYAVVEGWTVDQLGALYGVHRTTAGRRVEAARRKLGDLIRERVAARLAIERDEVDSIVRLVQSRVDVSLERALASLHS